MGFRFRKRVKIAPGTKLNVGKLGPSSVSFGGKTKSVTAGKRGVHANVRFGHGLSYRTRIAGCSVGCLVPLLIVILLVAYAMRSNDYTTSRATVVQRSPPQKAREASNQVQEANDPIDADDTPASMSRSPRPSDSASSDASIVSEEEPVEESAKEVADPTDRQFEFEAPRIWTSANGKFSTHAKLVKYDTGNVTLEREDGVLVTVRTRQLSAEDRDYLRTKIKPTRVTAQRGVASDDDQKMSRQEVKQFRDANRQKREAEKAATQLQSVQPNSQHGGKVWVKGYRRKDGTYVRGHWQSRPRR